MSKALKRAALVVLGFVVSALFLAYFAYRLRGKWSNVAGAVAGAEYIYIIPAVAFIGLIYCLRVLRWRLFLAHVRPVRYLGVTSATCIGFMSNCVLPVRLGELIRPFVLYKGEDVGLGHAFATAGAERIFDLIGLCALFLITWFAIPSLPAVPPGGALSATAVAEAAQPASSRLSQGDAPAGGRTEGTGITARLKEVRSKGMVLAVFAGLGFVGLLALTVFPSAFLRCAEVCTGLLPQALQKRLMAFAGSVVEAAGFMRSPWNVALAICYSVALWLSMGLSCLVLSLGFDLQLGVAGGCFVALCLAVAVAAPQAPSFVGVFHVAAMLSAEVFGASRSEAAAYAIVLWLVNVLPITLVGLGFLWYEGFTLGELLRGSSGLAHGEAASRE